MADSFPLERICTIMYNVKIRNTILLFYLFCAIVFIIFDQDKGILIVLLSCVCFGAVLGSLSENPNVWIAFTAGFVMLPISFVLYILFLNIGTDMQSFDFRMILKIKLLLLFCSTGLLASFGNVLRIIFDKKRRNKNAFSINQFLTWINTDKSDLSKIERIIIKIAALYSAITPIIGSLINK